MVLQQLFTTAFHKGAYACAMGVLLALITFVYAGVVFVIDRLTGATNEVAE